jgi:2-polyprenyl-3-methyl-5-hydroxy-6-metoxy-1,4-benzoquinol methylase
VTVARSAFLVGLTLLMPVMPLFAQNPVDDDEVWAAFVAWVTAAPEQSKLADYAALLASDGLAQEEVERRLELIRRLASEDPARGIELTYDRIYSRPLTGDPEQDGFTSTPSEFMVASLTGLKPGRALDVGAGQGRNAVWLAQHGWDVTAIDLSGAGLAAASENARKVGVEITTVKTTYDAFDFGTGHLDLILMILSWAPVSDPAFVDRLERALKPGGLVVFEHVIDKPEEPFPAVVHALEPDQLRGFFRNFAIESYDESVHQGDWGGPPTPLVRMVARKR